MTKKSLTEHETKSVLSWFTKRGIAPKDFEQEFGVELPPEILDATDK